jgi:RND family efflux transporter MFP subunit
MKNLILSIFTLSLAISGCTSDSLESRKQELADLKQERRALEEKIATLENEIAAAEGTAVKTSSNAILVNTESLNTQKFQHTIEVRGNVSSRTNVMLASETGGTIEQLLVREGDQVRKGQVLLRLDNDVLQNNIAEVRTALDLAKAVFERQSNLWEKNIGTEIQYLEAKNRKESLERQLATLQSQLSKTVIRAPFSGTVDKVEARIGEMAQPGMPLIRVVNPDQMYLEADVSERFIGDFNKGDKVSVYFPIQKRTLESKIIAVSEVINLENRTFKIEISMPQVDFVVKPNQVAVIEMVDYEKDSAIVVPTEVILSDAEGKFLYLIDDTAEKTEARKTRIDVGLTHNGKTEILKGLEIGDQLVLQGYRDLTDGTIVELTDKSTETAKL